MANWSSFVACNEITTRKKKKKSVIILTRDMLNSYCLQDQPYSRDQKDQIHLTQGYSTFVEYINSSNCHSQSRTNILVGARDQQNIRIDLLVTMG